MTTRPQFAALLLAVLVSAPLALAQQPAKKKKGAKPAASASATAEPAPAPTPDAPPPAASAQPDAPVPAAVASLPENSPPAEDSSANTYEQPGKSYYFVGARLRGTLIPQFMVNLFVNEGGTFSSFTGGLELDMRKDSQSTIPWLALTSFGFGDTLFEQKGTDHPGTDPSNWTVVNSSLWALFVGVDEQWSTPIDHAHHLDFEYGFGVGIGFVFGDLQNDWVFPNPNGSLHSSGNTPVPGGSGGNFSVCQFQAQNPSCQVGSHMNATIAKVGGYKEPNWLNGGAIPVVFPHIALPQLGLRYKPVKQFEARLSIGFSLTGFWLGISGDYGLEKNKSASETPSNKD